MASIVLWILGTFPNSTDIDVEHSTRMSVVEGQLLKTDSSIDAEINSVLALQLTIRQNQENYWEYEKQFVESDLLIQTQITKMTPKQQQYLEVLASKRLAETSDEKSLLLAWKTYLGQVSDIEDAIRGKKLEYSVLGRIGKFIEPVFTPIGFDWKITTALLGAIAAKEVFVSQFGIVFGIGEADVDDYQELGDSSMETRLSKRIKSVKYPEDHPTRAGEKVFNPLVAISLMIFCLISAPCMATVAVVIRETNSYLYGIWQFCGLSLGAYLVSLLVYQTGLYFKIGLV
ncbi:hypothetical protein MJH12_20175 [bacterium]|nr:hypothetical protein [bacterium]